MPHGRWHVEGATARVDAIGYTRASKLASDALAKGTTLRELAVEQGILTLEQFDALISPERVMRLGSIGPDGREER